MSKPGSFGRTILSKSFGRTNSNPTKPILYSLKKNGNVAVKEANNFQGTAIGRSRSLPPESSVFEPEVVEIQQDPRYRPWTEEDIELLFFPNELV